MLTARHHGARLAFAIKHQNCQIRHWHPVLFTDESRFILSTCDRCERVWRSRGKRYAACNIVQHDRFDGGSVMVWGGISMEGCTDLYMQDNGTLTAIRYRDEILGPIVRPYAGAVGPGFLLVHDNAQREHLWDIIFRSIRHHQVAGYFRLSRSSVKPWSIYIPQDTIRRLIRSMPRGCQASIQARGGHANY